MYMILKPHCLFQDCSWEEHGFSLVSELYSEVADILDNKFKTAYNMTYYTCGHKTHVDTFLFRQAVWNYLHCLYGIRYVIKADMINLACI